MTAIGLLHPGDMGAVVGAVLVGAGHDVAWVSDGRSAETATRAGEAALRDAKTVGTLAGEVDVIVSLCPPHAALETARAVAATGFAGVYVDANAIAPETAATVADIVTGAGARVVDGGVIGPPPRAAGTTRLYLSGDGAPEIAGLFDGTALEALVVAGLATAASALKMHYAAWTKGTTALLMAIRAGARSAGVEDALLAEWARSLPDLEARSQRGAASAVAKGWRWTAEMEEIAATLAALGLPDGFHRAAAEVYATLPRDAGAAGGDPVDVVIDSLRVIRAR